MIRMSGRKHARMPGLSDKLDYPLHYSAAFSFDPHPQCDDF